MDYSVEYGVGHCRIPYCVIPFRHRQLGCHYYGLTSVTVFDDLHQMCPFLGVERDQEEVVEYQQLRLLQFLELEGVAELPRKKLNKSLNFHKLRLFYIHKIL